MAGHINVKEILAQVLSEIARLSSNVDDICGETSKVYETEIRGVQEFAEDLNHKVHVLEKRFARFEIYINELQELR